MKNESERIKMAITFDEYYSELIRLAAKKVIALHGHFCVNDQWQRNKDFRRIVRLAVLAYCRGVINRAEKDYNYPLVAENLRPETAEEMKARVAGIVTEDIGAALTEAELRYCAAEDINPEDFLKAKRGR